MRVESWSVRQRKSMTAPLGPLIANPESPSPLKRRVWARLFVVRNGG
jgi:hypothetical protein